MTEWSRPATWIEWSCQACPGAPGRVPWGCCGGGCAARVPRFAEPAGERRALREGLLYDLLGRVHHQDTRDQSVRNLMSRYHIDEPHAKRVRDIALSLLAQVAAPWGLQSPEDRLLLAWAADLHEIGMDIAHSQYHKHGGYLLAHMDLPGFSRLDQSQLASLVRLHRRKFAIEDDSISTEGRILSLAVLLRLAVVLHRSRSTVPLPHIAASGKSGQITLRLPKKWLDKHP